MGSSDLLKTYNLNTSVQSALQSNVDSDSEYGLEPIIEETTNPKHTRYKITYQGIPIWGRQLIVHKQTKNFKLSGTLVSGIEKDIKDKHPTLSPDDACANILAQEIAPIKARQAQLIIYIDENKTAKLAYLLSFYSASAGKVASFPHYIIDANSGHVLKKWDEMHFLVDGEGPGGNATALPYRAGAFQYGNALPNLPSLGKFPMQRWGLWCYMETPDYRVISLENLFISDERIPYVFPIYASEEIDYQLTSIYGYCPLWSGTYSNQNDNGFSPVNETYSPVNDAMYFVNATLAMYKSYGIQHPLGEKDLPIRVFTHISGFDNAFSLPTVYTTNNDGSKRIKAHQQIVLSNGHIQFTAFTQSVIAHELSHNFTGLNSALVYSEQSGGINEAFSDMAAIALMDHVRSEYAFYWDGEDWAIGREVTKDGKPMRYMEHPSLDGRSIEHASNYKPKLNVHLSSGVFNRAFYLLAHQANWSIHKAFQVMIDANKNYWTPYTTFDNAACGVIQAAKDRQFDEESVMDSFKQVGVACPLVV